MKKEKTRHLARLLFHSRLFLKLQPSTDLAAGCRQERSEGSEIEAIQQDDEEEEHAKTSCCRCGGVSCGIARGWVDATG
eukprot:scaffold244038_cov34-Attheya_sp.AAC.1